MNWIFRIGIFAIVLFLVVVSAIKIDNWYNYDRHKEKIDLVVHFNNNNECDYQNQVQVKITNNSVRTISETKIWVIVTVRGYSKPINRLWDSLDSYKIIEPGEEWSSCWSIVTSEGERLDSSGKEVHLESFSVNFKSEEESRKLQADRIAANVSQKACDAGDAKECFSLGKKYDNGQGVKQNYFAAANLYQKACEGGNPKGCFNLGVMYSDGQGVKRDYLAAINLFQKVCDGGDARGCSNLGAMYANGQGLKQDYFAATNLFEKACNEGVAMGCYNLGVIYEYGKGMTQNTQKGLELYGKSCDMRDQNGCDAYERLKNSDM
jgi:hypothetical protein